MNLVLFILHNQRLGENENERQKHAFHNEQNSIVQRSEYQEASNTSQPIINGNKIPLSMWNKSHPIVFLHIAKAGGTSFDGSISKLVKSLNGRYIGRRHFDWSYIDKIKTPDVLV